MNAGTWLILWGSPVGIAIFFAGLGVLLWGVSRHKLSQIAQAEFELKEKQLFDARAREKERGGDTGR
jgi:hypothetical protein